MVELPLLGWILKQFTHSNYVACWSRLLYKSIDFSGLQYEKKNLSLYA